jgi:hypothetical protein
VSCGEALLNNVLIGYLPPLIVSYKRSRRVPPAFQKAGGVGGLARNMVTIINKTGVNCIAIGNIEIALSTFNYLPEMFESL